MNNTLPKKAIGRYRRFTGWDYSRGASLFITIATVGRRRLFGRVEGGEMALSPLGVSVYEAIGAIAALNKGVLVFGGLSRSGDGQTVFCQLWQQGYHEIAHIGEGLALYWKANGPHCL